MKNILVLGNLDVIVKSLENSEYKYFIWDENGELKIINKSTNKCIFEGIESIIICNKLNNDANYRKLSIEGKIIAELLFIGFNIKHIGTLYLIDAIKYIYDNFNDTEINLEKDIYPQIAYKYKKSVNNIKNNIIKATNFMYVETKWDTLKDYFSYHVDTKPTPKVIITTILKKLYKSF